MGARLSMIGLLVEDMGRSLGFYRTLGLTIPEGSEEETHVEVEVGGGLILFWDAAFVGTYDANREEPNGGYRIVPKFFVGSEKAVDALYAKLVADGHRGHKAPFGTHFGVYMAMVDDPDGDTVLLTAGQRPTAT